MMTTSRCRARCRLRGRGASKSARKDDPWKDGAWKPRLRLSSSTSTRIPFSLTLLYPWIPSADASAADVERFAPTLPGDLFSTSTLPASRSSRASWPMRPEPDDELRAIMRGLWKLYTQCPLVRATGFGPAAGWDADAICEPGEWKLRTGQEAFRTAAACATVAWPRRRCKRNTSCTG
jgi:hypothetical protein